MKAYLFAAALAVLLCTSCALFRPAPPTATPAQPAASIPVDVIIDHRSGVISPSGLIRKRPGDPVHIQIQHTNLECFSFNVTTAPTIGAQDVRDDTVDFLVNYDGDPITISIAAEKRTGATCDLVERKAGTPPGPWEIKVANDGWDLAFAGAFTTDNLSDPKFTIEEKTAAKPAVPVIGNNPAQDAQPATYEIFKSKGDAYRLGSAAMVHLYHTEPDPLGRAGVHLVPFSFGLGVGDSAHVRYYLGTGIRFDKKLFLNAGVVLGPQATLNRLPKDNITTDANFLTSHAGSRTSAKFFFSVSYSFIGVGPDAFKGPFTTVTPQPSTPATSAGATPSAAAVVASISMPAEGEKIHYKLSVSNGGAEVKGATLEHTFPAGVTGLWTVKAAAGAPDCGKAPVANTPEKSITRLITLPKDSQCDYGVTLTTIANIAQPANLPTTVTAGDAAKTKLFDQKLNTTLKPINP
jgi:hypothetical protein